MRNNLIIFKASLALALALTFGCSSGNSGDGSPSSAASGTFPDSRDGKSYKWVKIGTQTWMAENLNFAPQRSDCNEFGNDCSTYDDEEGNMCYNNDPANCTKYGRHYNWERAMQACPAGWHLPNNAEWDKLYRYADGTNGTESPYNSPTAGKLLKAKLGWIDDEGNPFGNGTDAFGFAALPGGGGSEQEGFPSGAGGEGQWWSASEASNGNGYSRTMYRYNDVASGRYETCPSACDEDECTCEAGIYKYIMLSVRCIKN